MQRCFRQLHFVAETKGSIREEGLRKAEKQNVESAEQYFRDVATNVMFHKIDSYDALMGEIT